MSFNAEARLPVVGDRCRHAHPPGMKGELWHCVGIIEHHQRRWYVLASWGPHKQRWFHNIEGAYAFQCGLYTAEVRRG